METIEIISSREGQDQLEDLHIRYDELDLYLRGRLKLNRNSAIEEHLYSCQLCRDRLSSALVFRASQSDPVATNAEKELAEPCFVPGDEAALTELSPLSHEREKVRITYVSLSGMGFLAPKFVWPGTLIQLRIGNAFVLGEVRHCRPYGNIYHVGMTLQHSTDSESAKRTVNIH